MASPVEGECNTGSTPYIEIKSFYDDKKVKIKTLVNTVDLPTDADSWPLRFNAVMEAYMGTTKKSYQ